MSEEKTKISDSSQEQDDDLYDHFKIVADKGQEPLRVDKFLLNRLDSVSRNKIQNAVKAESVLVNGQAVKSNYKVKPGDEVSVVLYTPSREFPLEPENIPLEVIYEDETLVVINKPAGLVVHPGSGNYTGTLVNALLHHFGELPASKGEYPRPGLIHRLDKNTSGLMVIAKEEFAMTHLAKQFFDRTIDRSYHALVWGVPEPENGIIEGNIGRHKRFRKKMDIYTDEDYGKPAITHYNLLKSYGYVSLIQCKLETGRTHQIRVHAKHIGHPVFNDEVYGGDKIIKGTVYTKYKQFIDNCFKVCQRQALHAASLGFIHPVTKEKLFFEAPLPEDFATLLDKWEQYYHYAMKSN